MKSWIRAVRAALLGGGRRLRPAGGPVAPAAGGVAAALLLGGLALFLATRPARPPARAALALSPVPPAPWLPREASAPVAPPPAAAPAHPSAPAVPAAAPPPVRGPLPWPVEGPILQGFGWAYQPALGEWAYHDGWDIGAPVGTPVRAIYPGTVIARGDGPDGLAVTVRAPGLKVVYAGLEDVQVQPGQSVALGQVIGRVGLPGPAEDSESSHLHLVLLTPSGPVNPGRLLALR